MFTHSSIVVNRVTKLWLSINWKKSTLQPEQQAEYLGVHLTSVPMKARLMETRHISLGEVLQPRGSTAMAVMHLLGNMAAPQSVVHLGLLPMKSL